MENKQLFRKRWDESSPPFFLILFLTAFLINACQSEGIHKETVLDGVVTIYDEIFYELPDVPRWCDRLGLHNRHIDIGDASLFVETEGEGIPLVLINGGPGGTHHYFHPHFSRAAEFSQVIYYDQRGCGLSDYEPGDGYSIQQAAADLDNLRKSLNIDQWVVAGYSYGGLLAQLYAVTYPESLAGLVLISSAISQWVELQPSRQYEYISPEERTRMQEINQHPGLTPEQRIFNRYLNGDWKRQSFYRPSPERLAELARYEWVHDAAFRNGIIQSMIPLDLEGAFNHFPVPTLIMEGRWDLTWNTDKPGVIHRNHPNSRLVMFDRSGHSPFEDEPEKFFSELRHFVKSLEKITKDKYTAWLSHFDIWQEELQHRQKSMDYLLRTIGWGKQSSILITGKIMAEQIPQLTSIVQFVRVGFAFYDIKEYEIALLAFSEMEKYAFKQSGEDEQSNISMALIWQGHMLDLLGRRQEAINVYERAAAIGSDRRLTFSQYQLSIDPVTYAGERMEKPFERIESGLD